MFRERWNKTENTNKRPITSSEKDKAI